jgi:hypothetical protein
MHHIGYTSRAIGNASFGKLEELCQRSAANNKLVGVTGLLVFDGVRYIQLIEGEASAVCPLMASIARDSRHDKIVYIINEATPERAFESWDLACIGFRTNLSGPQLLVDVKEKVRNVSDIYIKASFIGFAALAK